MKYANKGFRPYRNAWKPQVFTDAIKILISVNVLVFVLQNVARQQDFFFRFFGLVPLAVWKELFLWQPFTYLFLHSGFWHILVNMFVLWMFGSELETVWGKKRFFRYYFLTGVGAGVVTMLFHLESFVPVVGASGAIYGILLAYGFLFPDRTVYLYFLFPVKVKYFVIVIGAIAFISSLNPGYSNISHLTHLSGMVIGYVFLKSQVNFTNVSGYFRYVAYRVKHSVLERKNKKEKNVKKDVDRILDRINQVGYDGLTKEEQNFLYKVSKKISEKAKKD